MTLSVTFSKISKSQWFKVVKALLWAAAGLALALLTAVLAHNPKYLALQPFYNGLLVTLKQWVTQSEEDALNQLSPNEQALVSDAENIAKDHLPMPQPPAEIPAETPAPDSTAQ